jgi:protein-S-isoprenylcysteine O-methyltransferase Ste14
MIITALQNRKYWKNALLTISMLLLVLGFTPWDRWFSLDTDNELLSWLIDPLAGLLGLAIAIAISAHYINITNIVDSDCVIGDGCFDFTRLPMAR